MMKTFRKFAMVLALCLCFCLIASQAFAASTDKNRHSSMLDIQKEVQSSMNEMISITGSVLSGMAAGMQEGAEKAQAQLDGADGTRLVANKKDLAELLQVSVLKLEEQKKGNWRVTLAIRNANDFPVRLVNLTRKQSVLMLDTEGFAYDPVLQNGLARTLTVAAKAAVKATFDFSGLDAKPDVFRLFDTEFPVAGTFDTANAQPRIVTYNDKPISPLFGSSIHEVINIMGTPLGDCGNSPPHRLDYDGIHFWFHDGYFARAEVHSLSMLKIGGVTPGKNRASIVDLLGNPAKEHWGDDDALGPKDTYYMVYYLSNYSIVFKLYDFDAPPAMVHVQNRTVQ